MTLRCPAMALVVLLAVATRAAADDEAIEHLTNGHPEVTELLRTHPAILSYLTDPMWRDIVLHAPLIPGTPWQVHDLRRPQPPVVSTDPAACRSVRPPADATVLFDGRGLQGFAGPEAALWQVEHGELIAGGRENNHLLTRRSFGDVQIHLEFAEPAPAGAAWQFRGNSGVFLMDRYEIQILDSYENPTYPDGQAGALYGQSPPLVNASRRPGSWQCYDLIFVAPRFAAGVLQSPARVTLLFNGVLVQNDAAFLGPTRFGGIGRYEPHAAELPFSLQDHGEKTSRVRFRNIWARPLDVNLPGSDAATKHP